jgi:hypothetical protein
MLLGLQRLSEFMEAFGQPGRDGEKRDLRKKIVRPAQTQRKGAEYGADGVFILKKKREKIVVLKDIQKSVFDGRGVGRAGLLVQEGHFAEEVSASQKRQGDFVTHSAWNSNFDQAFDDDVKGRAVIAFAEENFSFGKGEAFQKGGKMLTFRIQHRLKKGDLLE